MNKRVNEIIHHSEDLAAQNQLLSASRSNFSFCSFSNDSLAFHLHLSSLISFFCDLTISVKENNLTIEGDIGDKDNGFIHQGISQRKFNRNFVLAEDVVVKGSDLSNGILTIYAERVVPEEKKARTIEIGSLKSSDKKQFLAE